MKEYNQEAVQKVLNSIEKDKPIRDCFQCPKYMNECQYKNTVMENCDLIFKKKYKSWKQRKAIWEGRLN